MEMSCQVKSFSNFVSESECISGEWEPSSMLQAGMSAINGESAILYNSFTWIRLIELDQLIYPLSLDSV